MLSRDDSGLTEIMERTHVPCAVCSQPVWITGHHVNPPVAICHPILNTHIRSKSWSQQEQNVSTREKQNQSQVILLWLHFVCFCVATNLQCGQGQARYVLLHLVGISIASLHWLLMEPRRSAWESRALIVPCPPGPSSISNAHGAKEKCLREQGSDCPLFSWPLQVQGLALTCTAIQAWFWGDPYLSPSMGKIGAVSNSNMLRNRSLQR